MSIVFLQPTRPPTLYEWYCWLDRCGFRMTDDGEWSLRIPTPFDLVDGEVRVRHVENGWYVYTTGSLEFHEGSGPESALALLLADVKRWLHYLCMEELLRFQEGGN